MPPSHLLAALLRQAAAVLECRAHDAPSSPFDGVPNQLALILKEMKHMSDKFDTEMTVLRADVAAQSTVIASATAAFRGLAAQLAAAEASATAAGATAEQIAAVTSLRTDLEANTQALSAAIPAGTPAAEPAATTSVEPVDPNAPKGAETAI